MDSSHKTLWVALIAVALIAVGGYLYPHKNGGLFGGTGTRFPNGISANTTSPVAGQILGTTLTVTGASALSGLLTLNAGTINAYPYATTTLGSATLTVAELANYDTLLVTPGTAGAVTLTLPASSTASTWLPTAGNRQKTCIVNATTSAGAIIVLAGGTGTKLIVASSSASALGSLQIFPQKMGCFDFVRAPATATTFDILGAFISFQ